MMKLVPVQCEKCGAKLTLYPGQTHCRCAHCGVGYVVQSGAAVPQLRDVDSLVPKLVDQTTYLVARGRLEDLEHDIPEAQAAVEACRANLGAAEKAEADIHQRQSKRQDTLLHNTLLYVVAGLVCWLVFIFNGGGERWIALALALLLSVSAWRSYTDSELSAQHAFYESRLAHGAVLEAQQTLGAAQAQLDALYVEQELATKRVKSYRLT